MSDERQVGTYFEEREAVKKMMQDMLKPKYKWTREVKSGFEKQWEAYWKAYNQHEKLCKEKLPNSMIEKIAPKAQKAQREGNRSELSKLILEYYKHLDKKYPNKYFGACKIDGMLGLDKGGSNDQHKSWSTHSILKELKDRGYLEQLHGSGFRLKKRNFYIEIEKMKDSEKKKRIMPYKKVNLSVALQFVTRFWSNITKNLRDLKILFDFSRFYRHFL